MADFRESPDVGATALKNALDAQSGRVIPEAPATDVDPYWCFISYRHADNREQDRKWGSWLHQELERYEIPGDLVGSLNENGERIPERIYPVFRDEESLPADAHLGERINQALDRSRYLLVLCSPRAVESRYVNEEIKWFQENGRNDRVITAIIDGEPGDAERECFPAALREFRAEPGSDAPEPLAADFRLPDGSEGFTSAEAYRYALRQRPDLGRREVNARVKVYEAKLRLMKLKIIAGILGVSLEKLRDRDKLYQLERARRRTMILAVTFSVIAATVVAAIFGWLEARDQSHRAQGEQLAAEAETLLPRLPHRTTAATTMAIEALSLSPSIQTDRLLRRQLEVLPRMRRTMVFLDRVFDVAISPDGRYVGAGDESGVIKIYDLEEDRLAHVLQVETTTKAIAFAPDGKTFVTVHDAQTRSLPIEPGFVYEMIVTSSYYADGPMQQRPPDGEILAGAKVKILADQGSYLRVQTETGVTGSVRADAVNAKRTATLGEAIVWNVRTAERLFSVAHKGDARSLDYSPDGRFLATASEDKTAKLTEISTRRTIVVEHDSLVTDVAFTPEGERFATSSYKSVKGWAVENGKQAFQVLHGDTVWAIAISPNGEMGASVARNGELFVWKVSDGEKVFSVKHPHGADDVAWRPDGAELAVATGGVVYIYDTQSWRRVRTLRHSEELPGFMGVAYGPKGRFVASWGADATTRVWDAEGREFFRIAHEDQTSGAVFFPDGSAVVSVGWDGGVRIADLRKLGEAYTDWTASGRDKDLKFSPSGRHVATLSRDNILRFWSLPAGALVSETQLEFPAFLDAAVPSFTPADETVLVVSDGKDSETGKTRIIRELRADGQWGRRFLHRFPREKFGPPVQVLFKFAKVSRNNKYMVSGYSNKTPILWDFQRQKQIKSLPGPHQPSAAAFSADEELVVIGGGHRFQLYTKHGRLLQTVDLDDDVKHIEFSPDDRRLYVAGGFSGSGFARIYKLERGTGEVSLRLSEDLEAPGPVERMVLSPDGRYLAVAYSVSNFLQDPGAIIVWDAANGAKLAELGSVAVTRNLTTATPFLTFSKDGDLLATGGRSDLMRLWSVPDFQLVSQLIAPGRSRWTNVDFSPDGNLFAGLISQSVHGLYFVEQSNMIVEALNRIEPAKYYENVYRIWEPLARWDVLQAKRAYEQAIVEFGTDHFAPHLREELSRHVMSEARKWIKYQRADLVDEAVAAFELALQLAPDSPPSSREWAELCWQGAVLGRAEEVLFAGDRAVDAAPDDPQAYEARGLARALIGNIDGAKADFAFFIENSRDAKAVEIRKGWVARLEAGKPLLSLTTRRPLPSQEPDKDRDGRR